MPLRRWDAATEDLILTIDGASRLIPWWDSDACLTWGNVIATVRPRTNAGTRGSGLFFQA
jgi:hypothetical protein